MFFVGYMLGLYHTLSWHIAHGLWKVWVLRGYSGLESFEMDL